MTVRRLSPTANLFRNSRLFSLPPPLPKPQNLDSRNKRLEYPNATSSSPTHAAIETSQSSLSKGDWGLKRPLPSRIFSRTSTPLIRIGDVDSIDHIAEFESAADYTLTLRKWQEMNLPISVPLARGRSAAQTLQTSLNDSVFESERDNTVMGNGEMEYGRWKFKGPWLPGKTEGEFQRYVKNIRKRKLPIKFREFVCKQLRSKTVEAQKRKAMDQGEDYKSSSTEISEEEVNAHIRTLREDQKSLREMIEKFLDLPNFTKLSGELAKANFQKNGAEHVFQEGGPPQTHPSAGLSYLRTNSHIHNHPILGPQEYGPPVCGRILLAHTTANGRKRKRARIGIAGVVAIDTRRSGFQHAMPPGLLTFDPDIPGGAKAWFHPKHAYVDPQGRIRLSVHSTDHNTLALYEGILQPEEVDQPVVRGADRDFPSTARTQGSNQRYGLEGMEISSSDGRAKPFSVQQESDADTVMNLLNFSSRKS